MARLHNHKTVVLASLLQQGLGLSEQWHWTLMILVLVYVTLLHQHAAESLNFSSTEFVLFCKSAQVFNQILNATLGEMIQCVLSVA